MRPLSLRFLSGFFLIAAMVTATQQSSAQVVFVTTGNLATARSGHTATTLQDGTILIAGGIGTTSALASAEIYDPVTGTFSGTGNMTVARTGHKAILLANGEVLMIGGDSADTAELYNPTTRTFAPTGGLTGNRGSAFTATLLSNGEVLVAGGNAVHGLIRGVSTAEVYNPTTGTFTLLSGGLCGKWRYNHTATLLANGQVLIAGGMFEDGYIRGNVIIWTPDPQNTGCLYNPTTQTFGPTITGGGGTSNTATILQNGNVLLVGGGTSSAIYNTATGAFAASGNLQTGRVGHAAVPLNDGTVLIIGGTTPGQSTPLSSAELYNPSKGTFSTVGNLNTARTSHTATLMVGGAVLVAGGYGASSILASSENYLSGMVYPKYAILGVTYAPPGSLSNVNYTNTTAFGTSSTTSSSFTNASKFSVSVGWSTDSLFGLTPSGSITGNFSTGWSQGTDTSTSISVNQTSTNGIIVDGPSSSAVGIDHDFDIVWIWLNPITLYTITPSGTGNILHWTGNAYDMRDPVGRMHVYGVYVAYLNGDAAIPSDVASVLARPWAPNPVDGSGPGLTTTDLKKIAGADPFWQCVTVPSACPTSVDQTRFSPNSSTNIQYVPPPQGGQPITQTGSISYQTTSGQGTGGTDTHDVSYGIDVKANGGFLVDFNIDISYSQDFTWTNKWSTTSTKTVGQSASFSVTGPQYSDHYTGPTVFNVYQDTVYGSFMFFPCSGGSC